MRDFTTTISATELATHLNEPDWLVIDCRFNLADIAAGQTSYQKSHIPGAVYIDLEQDMSGDIIPGQTGRHPLPSPDDFVTTLRQLGVNNHTQVVAYDAGPGMYAARLWWMLRWLGHSRVAVLQGGFQGWESDQHPTTASQVEPAAGSFAAGSSLTRVVSADDLLHHGDTMTVLDARDQARFDGEFEPIDAVAGHIPGAICAPFGANLDTSGQLMPVPVLQQHFSSLGVTQDADVACYCGSGVTAAINILALVQAGFSEPALYPGSWSEWIVDPERPVATR